MKALSVTAIGRLNQVVSGAFGASALGPAGLRHGKVSLLALSPHGVPFKSLLPMSNELAGENAAAVSGSACQAPGPRFSRWLPRSVETFQPRRSAATRRTYSLRSTGKALSAGPFAIGPTGSPNAVQLAPSLVVTWR